MCSLLGPSDVQARIGCFNRCSHLYGARSYLVGENAYGKSAERTADGFAKPGCKEPKALA